MDVEPEHYLELKRMYEAAPCNRELKPPEQPRRSAHRRPGQRAATNGRSLASASGTGAPSSCSCSTSA